MRLRIRTKFIGILIIAAVLPLIIALSAAQLLGYRYYRAAQGNLFETMAEYLSNSLSLAINKQLEDLDEWITLSGLHETVATTSVMSGDGIPTSSNERIAWMEKRWSSLDERTAPLNAMLENALSRRLKAFRVINPLFAEIFVTDANGELIGATSKTSDYWQGDEKWWRQTAEMPTRSPHVEGISYDQSAGVYSIDVAFSVRDPEHPKGPPLGIVKGVVDATPLLGSLDPVKPDDKAIRQVVLGSGEILVRLTGDQVVPLDQHIAPSAISRITGRSSGWTIATLGTGEESLVGFSTLRLINPITGADAPRSLNSMHVLVYNSVAEALQPIRRQIYMVGGIGTLLVLGFAFVGYYIAGRKIIDPVERLRNAVQTVAASAKGSAARHRQIVSTHPSAIRNPVLDRIRQVKTGDELEQLAGDFAYMAQKVIGYHEELEAEIAAQTAEIQRDLDMAREFQEALMPRTYPEVPTAENGDPVHLRFHHVYKPASSVGGDFFDVMKLSDHSAGIFIADVMGHGARSALITAILRTLLQDLAGRTNDPAEFLTLINRHFHEIVSQSEEFIFVSAFYVIINTEAATATYAAAGHPSPFFADRTRQRVHPLIEQLRDNPALGLFPASTYRKWTKQLIAGDLFVLFTDGLHEATNAAGEEYGVARLESVIAEHLDADADHMNTAIIDDVNHFIDGTPLGDDLCLVTVEIAPAETPQSPRKQKRKRLTV